MGWELFYENRNKDFMLHRIKFGIVKISAKMFIWERITELIFQRERRMGMEKQTHRHSTFTEVLRMKDMPAHKTNISR